MSAIAVILLAWWALSPWAALAIGARRGHPVLGWLLGLVPLAGPVLAWWLLRRGVPGAVKSPPGGGAKPAPGPEHAQYPPGATLL